MTNLSEDPRYPLLQSDEGREELGVYLQWIFDNELSDIESNFVDYAVARAGMEDRRHLFLVWKKLMELAKVNLQTTLQNMRFFMNPTDHSFRVAEMAGWFDFLPQAYQIMSEVPAQKIVRPEYKLAGVPVKLAI